MKRRPFAVMMLAGVFIVLAVNSSYSSLAPQAALAPASTAPARHYYEPAATVWRATPALAAPGSASNYVALDSVVRRYCAGCHNDRSLTGNLSLASFSVAAAADHGETAEKMIKKLRAHMMPPPGSRRPSADTLTDLVESLERALDEAAERSPNPGGRTVQKLNRAEYERAIGELLLLKIDASRWLPADQMSANFDNIADAQSLSPTLLGSYLNAARDVSRLALGDPTAASATFTYANSEFLSQNPTDRLEGAPFGTRGGIVVTHDFPADGEYTLNMTTALGSGYKLEDIDISVDGERVALLHFERGVQMRTEPIRIRAGQRRVSATFIRRTAGIFQDLIRPHDYSQAGSGNSGAGTTALPHLRDLIITGPENVTGVSDNPPRGKIFSCRPTSAANEQVCARQIISSLGREAYRRPLQARDVDALMAFFNEATRDGAIFEEAIGSSLRAILASPHFIFRAEREPAGIRSGENYRLADTDLATRLAFFIWGAPPDSELVDVAAAGRLSNRRTLEEQTRRLLADPRSEALATRFAAQWLRLQDLEKVAPDAFWFPNYDLNLAQAMRRETELFFHNLVREDRSVLELFNGDYSFVNERLARHYGIRGVLGSEFRKVSYPDDTRRGILGHGSVLVQTSLGNRTSPVLRGKWVMEVLLGTPPPPPPPGVPDLEETDETADGRILTTRERMEKHRTAPTCRSCHQYMDPIGLALDNFDVTGKWRYRENGMALDTRGTMYDGTEVSTPAELANALLARPVPLLRNFTENLLAYAIGRRVEYFDQPAIRTIARTAEQRDHRLSAYILGVVESVPFQMKRASVTTQDAGSSQSHK
jgi:hypothetical protein